MKESPLVALLAAGFLLVQPLSAIHWQQVEGNFFSHPEGPGQREAITVYDWQLPKASLLYPPQAAGRGRLGADHPCQLLPQPVRDWLTRLGVAVPEGSTLRCTHTLSIACVLHQPCREESFAAAERLWYRKDGPPGTAAVLFIPLSRGRINFARQADFSTSGPLKAVLPNGFVQRVFPFGPRDSTDWFYTHISGADDRQPFAFASLIFCPRQQQVLVAIEVIPPHGMPVDNLQAVEDLLKRFTNPNHPSWRGSRVTVVESEPDGPEDAPHEEPRHDDAPEEPQERPEAPRQPEQRSPEPELQPRPEPTPAEDLARRQQERSQQNALAAFACSSPPPLPPEIEQRFTLPEDTPFLSEDDLARLIAEVLLEDIETHGDPMLEEILHGGLQEHPSAPEDLSPPNVVPESLVTPPNPPPVKKPPRPSTELHLPGKPSEYGKPEVPRGEDEIKHLKDEVETQQVGLFRPFGPVERRNDLIYRSFCPCGPGYNHDIWADANNCPWEYWHHEAARRRVEVLGIEDRIARYNANVQRLQQLLDVYNRKCDAWKDWLKWYNPQVEEYNRRLRSEHERVNRELQQWVERVKQEAQRWVDQVKQKEQEWNGQIEHHNQQWLEWAQRQGQEWGEQIERRRRQWVDQIEKKWQELRGKSPQELRKYKERVEQELRDWDKQIDQAVRQWKERVEHLQQQWVEKHRQLIQRWNERIDQLAAQWNDQADQGDSQWYEQVCRECREWREQPVREWRQWGEQLTRETQQWREQSEREWKRIQDESKARCKSRVEEHLESRAAELLGQSYANAQYFCASLFPQPNI
jgi:hypothetical protein